MQLVLALPATKEGNSRDYNVDSVSKFIGVAWSKSL